MMTQATSLKALLNKIESGTWKGDWKEMNRASVAHNSAGVNRTGFAWEAYNGDLNAAKALHEAVLPGWHRIIWGHSDFAASVSDPNRRHVKATAMAATEARAWLIAILRARLAEVEA